MLTPSHRKGQFLGQGSTKRVTVGRWKGSFVAIATSVTQDRNPLPLLKEAALMKILSNPHIQKLLAIELSSQLGQVRLVTPIAKYGSVCDLLDTLEFENTAHCFTHAHAAAAYEQVAAAVAYLNSVCLDHADLRARNVLVFRFKADGIYVRLADFSEARPGTSPPAALAALRAELIGFVPQKTISLTSVPTLPPTAEETAACGPNLLRTRFRLR